MNKQIISGIKEPTLVECSHRTKVYETDKDIGFACWYPQMGGYSGKCIAIFNKEWTLYDSGATTGGCIELYVWHDGEFPFTDEDGAPSHIHICVPEQFIELGKFLSKTNSQYCIQKK